MLAYSTIDQAPPPVIEAVHDDRATAPFAPPAFNRQVVTTNASGDASSTVSPLPVPAKQVTAQRDSAQMVAWVREHQSFALKSLTEGLTTKEAARWRLVKWQIDVVRNAAVPPRSQALETLLSQRRQLAAEIEAVVSQLQRPRARATSAAPRRRGA